MMPRSAGAARVVRLAGGLLLFLGFSAGVVVLMLWLAGRFEPKVPVAETEAQRAQFAGPLATVRKITRPVTESAVGTIRAVHESTIGSKLLARVLEINLKAGQPIRGGDVLVRLDDTDLRAKLQQAKAAQAAAEAAREQAAVDEKRFAALVKTNAVSRQQYEQTATALRSTDAELNRTREAVKEAQAMLDWATVRSPIDGLVIDKRVEVGDTVTPGQTLVTLFDPKRMQMVASVRESLALQLRVGQDLGVRVDGLKKTCTGTVSEIVPQAQSASRTFQVKVTGPCPPGIYSGMFGRILVPLDEEQLLVIPRQAVRRVGQLELVDVVEQGRVIRRAIRTGRPVDDEIEVLSGLTEGEQVVLPTEKESRAQEAHHG
jgi:RND family efflux transporter MFP subunit